MNKFGPVPFLRKKGAGSFCYNITKILNVYYNFIKILDNRQKRNKIVV